MDTCVGWSEKIEISAQDDRLYRSFTLDNSLQVLVISQPDTDKAAAAMDVRVGHLCDPDQVAGLAHFLEHMLFLGTEKYPDENSYNQFLSTHGGRSNAFTSMTDTNYYFDVAAPHLSQVLDRFAQFFIAPLFTASATTREMNAVDSENAKNLQNDYWRFNQMYKNSARKEHAYHKFGTGNLTTLDKLPKERGIDVREELIKFHQTYYSASIMKLVICGREDLDTLQKWATDMFSAIKNTNRAYPIFPGVPYGPEQTAKHIIIAPVKDLTLIEVMWPIQPIKEYYTVKPDRYLSHLIGHEGKGSLLSLLKDRGWANELSAGVNKNEDNWAVFAVTIDATSEGIKQVNQVVAMIYQYLELMRQEGPKQWIFDETRDIAAMNFRFRNKEPPMSYVQTLAGRMHNFPTEHIISGNYLLREFQPQFITELLNQLIPSNMRLTVVSKTFSGQTESVEKWYETPYTESSIPEPLLEEWSNVTVKDLHFPAPNDFICTDFKLITPDAISAAPVLSHETESSRLWYKFDNVFCKPKLNVFLNLITPVAYASPHLAVLTDLYVECVNDALTEVSYDAELAGMKYILQHTMKGFEMYVSGYSHKLPKVVEIVAETLRHLPTVRQDIFDRIKDKTKRSYANFFQEQPYQHGAYDTGYMLEHTRWHNTDKLAALESITLEHVSVHGQALFAQVFVEALIHGNCHETQAKDIVQHVVEKLNPACPLFKAQLPQLRIAHLQERCEYLYRVAEPNVENSNSAIQVTFQIGPQSLHQKALLDLLGQMIQEPCFKQLRTVEQLGYIVFSGPYRAEDIQHLRFIIQSDKMSPEGLDERIELFVESFYSDIQQMEQNDFDKYKDAIRSKLLEKPKTPWEESMRYWRQITKTMYEFDLNEKTAAAVAGLSKQALLEFFQTYIAKNGSKRAKLSCQIYGNKHSVPSQPCLQKADVMVLAAMELESDEHDRTIHIGNMDAFKRTIPLYPKPKSRL